MLKDITILPSHFTPEFCHASFFIKPALFSDSKSIIELPLEWKISHGALNTYRRSTSDNAFAKSVLSCNHIVTENRS